LQGYTSVCLFQQKKLTALLGPTQSDTAFLQVDISRVEPFLGPNQEGAGPSLYANPAFPLPCHGTDPKDEAAIPAGFPYTPTNWCSASPTALAYCDDGCGASMAHSHAHQQPASNILGDVSANLLSVVHHKYAQPSSEFALSHSVSRLQYDHSQLLPTSLFLPFTTLPLCLVHVINFLSAKCCCLT